jgi:hypothetical protein
LQRSDPISKDNDLVKIIADGIRELCGCNFMEDRITDVMFLCFATSPKDVIFHAQLHGTLRVNVSDLTNYLQKWADFDILHFPPPLVLESFCTLNSSMPVEQCSPDVRSAPTAFPAGTAVGVVIAIIFIILVIIVIAILLLKYRRHEILKTLR